MQHSDTDEISKSQRKRDLRDLKQLGAELLDFSEAALRAMGLPESLLDALLEARRITANGARKRQLQYIGKLLKEIDAAPVRAAVNARKHQHDTGTRAFHQLEELRQQLLLGDAALKDVLALFPQTDRQHLRKLARLARQEQDNGQPRGAGKALFRYLRDLQQETPPDETAVTTE